MPQVHFTSGSLNVLFFRLLFSTDRYSFLSGGLPFWQVTLAVTLPVVAVVMWLWLWRLVKTVGARLGSALLFVLLIGMVVWAYVVHLNYVLDTNPPKVHTLKIENKKVDNNRKSADDYEFKFTINGQALWHEVSWEEYHAYEIGDVYNLAENQGAFGVPYFTTDDK